MIVLGIIDSKPSTAAVVIDGKILSIISEERLCRLKMANGMPRQSISRVLDEAGVKPEEVDQVVVAQNAKMFEPEATPWSGWFEDSRTNKKGVFTRLGSSLAPVVGSAPFAWKAHHGLKNMLSRDRVRKLPSLIQEAYGIQAPFRFLDHHFSHAASAYYTSNFDRALIITLDGGGDGRSGSVYMGEGGRLKQLASVDSFNSLGNFYSYITVLCGFKAEKHEGKVTGLAALGEPLYADILRKFVRYQEPGRILYSIPMYHASAVQRIREAPPANFDKAVLAASVQLVLEEVGVQFIRYWLRRTGLRKIAVAGGVFSNVKFNQRVHELEEVDEIFVHPAMDDSGLALGGALAAEAETLNGRAQEIIQHLPNVYFGPEYSSNEIERAIRATGCLAEHDANIHRTIAERLAEGHVVARFTGRMEYGPRALGHRSILYQTTDPSVNDWLNERLKRTEFMPFAPATLKEHANACYDNLKGAEDPSRFMTITFNCTPQMRKTSPGVVHVDGTARPQVIDPETAPDFYGILTEYYQITNIPSLINTSFNMHEEPIVCSPEDALRSFQQGNLDYLAIGDWLVTHPELANLSQA